MGGKEVDETALLRLLALLLHQTILIITALHFTSLEYTRLLFVNIVMFYPPWNLFLTLCMIFHWLAIRTLICAAADLLDDVPRPGRGSVPQVRPGLEGAISILLCPPTMCTKHTCVYHTSVPICASALGSASYAEEGKCAPVRLAQGLKVLSVLNFVRVTVVHKCAICPQAKCAHGGP